MTRSATITFSFPGSINSCGPCTAELLAALRQGCVPGECGSIFNPVIVCPATPDLDALLAECSLALSFSLAGLSSDWWVRFQFADDQSDRALVGFGLVGEVLPFYQGIATPPQCGGPGLVIRFPAWLAVQLPFSPTADHAEEWNL